MVDFQLAMFDHRALVTFDWSRSHRQHLHRAKKHAAAKAHAQGCKRHPHWCLHAQDSRNWEYSAVYIYLSQESCCFPGGSSSTMISQEVVFRCVLCCQMRDFWAPDHHHLPRTLRAWAFGGRPGPCQALSRTWRVGNVYHFNPQKSGTVSHYQGFDPRRSKFRTLEHMDFWACIYIYIYLFIYLICITIQPLGVSGWELLDMLKDGVSL